uniref:Uncharacterized protein n=1 Tax=viral metagenome TaxID=1070528 RepID=A0A6C0JBG1_9ZZZZ
MNIQYFFMERIFNKYFEEFIIKGFSPIVNKDFISLISRINPKTELVEDMESLIVKGGEWFYKIQTTFYIQNSNYIRKPIIFDYIRLKLHPHIYIAFIGSVINL